MLHMCNNVHKELPTLTAVWFFQFKFLILLKGPYQKPSIYRRKKKSYSPSYRSYFPLSSMSSFSFWGPALLPMAPLAALVMGKLSSPLLEGTANSSSSPFGGSTLQVSGGAVSSTECLISLALATRNRHVVICE